VLFFSIIIQSTFVNNRQIKAGYRSKKIAEEVINLIGTVDACLKALCKKGIQREGH
jgi:hypothetical protein